VIIGLLFWLFVFLVVYTYFGYPALLAMVARKKQALPTLADSALPTVTLLIAAYDEEQSIAGKLENSLKLDYPSHQLEIIVAADGSSDGTVDIVKSFAGRGIKLSYSAERKGKMAAINRAISIASGEIVVFSDANNIYAEDAIRKLVVQFADPQVGGVTGSKHIVKSTTQLGNSEGLYWKYESFIREKESLLGCCTGVCGEIFSIRRILFERPPSSVINDDFVMAMSLIGKGYQIAYAQDARSYEQVSGTAEEENIRRARIIAGRYQALLMAKDWLPFNRPILLWQILSHKILRAIVPFAMLGALATNLLALVFPPANATVFPLLALAWPFALSLFGLQLVFYGMAVWGERMTQLNKSLPVWLYLPTFLVNSNWAALKGLVQFVRGRQTAIWKKARRETFDLAAMEQAAKQQNALGEEA
jgi:cellulose synthase/poly-beta-1,6-N-acetylglucosamine synthase-like glycosyltransferase